MQKKINVFLGKLCCRIGMAFEELQNNEGAGVVEIALIIIVIIALIILFREQMLELIQSIFQKIGKEWQNV